MHMRRTCLAAIAISALLLASGPGRALAQATEAAEAAPAAAATPDHGHAAADNGLGDHAHEHAAHGHAQGTATAAGDTAAKAKAGESKPDKSDKPDKEASAAEKKAKAMGEQMSLLAAEYQLLMQKQKNELARLELEKQALAAEAALRSAKLGEELAAAKEKTEKLSAAAALQKAEQEAELAAMKAEVARLSAERELAAARRAGETDSLKAETEKLSAENALLMQQIGALKAASDRANLEHQAAIAEVKRAVELADAKRDADRKVATDIARRGKPFEKGTLHVSDRRIALNGVIMMPTADYIADRIQFFNNQSKTDPIFIVIDSSPGGSVMAGYRILEAMDSSEAPIHVVVKSFAASMAAAITTLADESYAYPNAILLHHQMSSSMRGNLTQQKEQLENALEWSRRLADPIAKKMGVAPKKFVELMYANNSDGDWEEFADKAVKLKWVDRIVHEIREEGIVEHPDSKSAAVVRFHPFIGQAPADGDGPVYVKLPQPYPTVGPEQTDGEGRPFVKLQRLQPFDHWFLYDPDNYYR